MKPVQLSLDEFPEGSYPIRVWCKKCGHDAEMRVSIDAMEKLHKLKCGNCGASGKAVTVELLEVAESGKK